MATSTKKSSDLQTDQAPTPEVVDAQRDQANPNLGKELAQEAADKRSPTGGEIKGKDNGVGGVTVVATPTKDQSDNGKTYKNPRIVPSDTNAPDAGLTPDGRRIAE
jgi:hypothetical protein